METHKTVIDGYGFELTQLPGWTGFKVFGKLVQLLGPSAGPIAKIFAAKKGGGVSDPTNTPTAMFALFASLKDASIDEVIEISKVMLTNCIISGDLPNGQKLAKLDLVYDETFRGKLFTQYRLLWWAMGVQFGNFFVDLKNAVPVFGAAFASISPKESDTSGPAPV